MPLLLSHSIWYIFDHILLYFAIFCYILLLHLTRYQSEPHKRQVLCRGFSPKTSLPPYRCGWRSLCPGWKGTFARHFRQGVRVFWLIVFPIFSLTDQVIETIWNQVFSIFRPDSPRFAQYLFPAALARRPLGMIWCFRAAWIWEDVKISEGMKAGKWRRTMEKIWKNHAWFQNYPPYLGYVGMMIHKYHKWPPSRTPELRQTPGQKHSQLL